MYRCDHGKTHVDTVMELHALMIDKVDNLKNKEETKYNDEDSQEKVGRNLVDC